MRAVLGERELLVLLGADLDVVGTERDGLTVDLEIEVPRVVERVPDHGAVDDREELLDPRQ